MASGVIPAVNERSPTYDLSEDDTLYFLHIHKTAGSSLRDYIMEKFDRADISRFAWELPALLEQPREDLRRLRAIAGHFGYYLEGALGERPVYVTMLRDPVERTLSAFSDQQWREDLWLHDHIKDMTIDDYVFDNIGGAEVMNFQVRSLAFDDVERHFHGCSELWRDPEQARAVFGDRALLDLAKQRLERFAFVGVQDRFEEGLRLLAYTFGWPVPDRIPRENIRRRSRETLAPRTLERIRELTALDQELYEFAGQLFEHRHATLTDELIEQRHRAAMERRPRLDRVCMRFENALMGRGWHARVGKRDWTGRWTGPGTESTLHFPLSADRPYTLLLRAGSFRPDILAGLTIEANGQPLTIESEPCRDRPNHLAMTAEVSQAVMARSPEFLELRFGVPRTISPHEHNPDRKDKRQLGVFIEVLEVLPSEERPVLGAWSARMHEHIRAEDLASAKD